MRVVGGRVAVDGLLVEDECAVRLVSEREQNGEDAVKLVRDAVEIGARVLDREQAGATAEFVKTEFERAAAQMNVEFTDKARQVAEFFGERVDHVFGPENGQLAKDLRSSSRTARRHRFRTACASSSRRRWRARARTC